MVNEDDETLKKRREKFSQSNTVNEDKETLEERKKKFGNTEGGITLD